MLQEALAEYHYLEKGVAGASGERWAEEVEPDEKKTPVGCGQHGGARRACCVQQLEQRQHVY